MFLGLWEVNFANEWATLFLFLELRLVYKYTVLKDLYYYNSIFKIITTILVLFGEISKLST